jgi:hypothetical protein
LDLPLCRPLDWKPFGGLQSLGRDFFDDPRTGHPAFFKPLSKSFVFFAGKPFVSLDTPASCVKMMLVKIGKLQPITRWKGITNHD